MLMNYAESLENKSQLIRNQFESMLGKPITGYELAELWCEEEKEWSEWMDIPLFLSSGEEVISISWQKFNELAIEKGRTLPFSLSGSTVRWLSEGVSNVEPAIGKIISSISIGRGEMSVEDREIEIWTRLLIGFDGGEVLEVFNALDESGIVFHTNPVSGETIKCI